MRMGMQKMKRPGRNLESRVETDEQDRYGNQGMDKGSFQVHDFRICKIYELTCPGAELKIYISRTAQVKSK